jgi:hypothetical protein
MPYALLPDVDQALIDYLDTHAALTPLHGGRVGTKLASTLTSVRIASLSGPQPWPWEALPEYQVEWWGGTDLQAKTLARTGEAALWDFLSAFDWVTGVSMPLSQLWSPDETSGRPRFITQVQYRVHPEEA